MFPSQSRTTYRGTEKGVRETATQRRRRRAVRLTSACVRGVWAACGRAPHVLRGSHRPDPRTLGGCATSLPRPPSPRSPREQARAVGRHGVLSETVWVPGWDLPRVSCCRGTRPCLPCTGNRRDRPHRFKDVEILFPDNHNALSLLRGTRHRPVLCTASNTRSSPTSHLGSCVRVVRGRGSRRPAWEAHSARAGGAGLAPRVPRHTAAGVRTQTGDNPRPRLRGRPRLLHSPRRERSEEKVRA